MRVIAGQYRGRKLKSPPSLETRPTSDRLRETLFNVIAPRIVGARFLDLCAGTGAVGIEALSRGATHATFVDRSRDLRGLIEANLHLCQVDAGSVAVVTADVLRFLRQAVKSGAQTWDVIFFDPPYADDYLNVLGPLGNFSADVLRPGGLLIVEHFHKQKMPDEIGILTRQRVLKQGDSALSFYGRRE